jgi:hypothetical protein
MFYPIKSFFSGIFLGILLIILANLLLKIFSTNNNFNTSKPLVSYEIDAEMIGEINHQHNSFLPKNSKNFLINDSQNKKINHRHVDNINNHLANDKNDLKPTNQDLSSQKIVPLHQPLPEIPDELRYDFLNSQIIAKFYIDENGMVYDVSLIQASSVPKLNFLLKKSLLKWQFPAKNQTYHQIIIVNFLVN